MMINQRLFLFTALLVFILIFSGCGSDDDSEQSSDPAQDEDDNDSDDDDDDDNDDDNIPEPFCEINEDAIDAMIAKMTLEQRAAQLLVLGEMAFPFLIPEKTEKLITDLGIGGMALQFLNALFPGPARMSNLLNELNGMAMGREPGIPLFFAVDQEGGTTQTWQSITGATDGPGNMALGALDDVDATYRMYAMMGREARAFGANTSYSPELDLVASHEAAWVYTKGFGESGELAGRHAKAAIKGFRSELILGAMKHFPAGGCVWRTPMPSRRPVI